MRTPLAALFFDSESDWGVYDRIVSDCQCEVVPGDAELLSTLKGSAPAGEKVARYLRVERARGRVTLGHGAWALVCLARELDSGSDIAHGCVRRAATVSSMPSCLYSLSKFENGYVLTPAFGVPCDISGGWADVRTRPRVERLSRGATDPGLVV